MRSHDGRREPWAEPLGVRLGGVGPWGGERRHYPDLLLVTSSGERVAVELELTAKPRRRREEILGGYAIEARVDAVLYLVESKRLGRAITDSSRSRKAGRTSSGAATEGSEIPPVIHQADA